MAFEPGQTIEGKYRVVRHIGAGGMGAVYEGENLRIGRRVAIKVLHAEVATLPEFVERFEREARAAVRVGSPHVCDVLDLGDLPNGDRFIVMEYLEGVSLEQRMADRHRLTPQELAPIALELLEGLGTMHAAGVIHRDLKPGNVFLMKTTSGRGEAVKILDFGVAKLESHDGVGSMTRTGAMMGTPLYMSPEQARGARDVDRRTDLYAASVIFYQALAGQLPFNANSLNELIFKIVLEDPRPLREIAPNVDETFAGLIHRGLAREADKRFDSAHEYQKAIVAWSRSPGHANMALAVTLPSVPPGTLAILAPTNAETAPEADEDTRAEHVAKTEHVRKTEHVVTPEHTAKTEHVATLEHAANVPSDVATNGTPTAWGDDDRGKLSADVAGEGPTSEPGETSTARTANDAPNTAGSTTPERTDGSKARPARRSWGLVAGVAAAIVGLAVFVARRGGDHMGSSAAETTSASGAPSASFGSASPTTATTSNAQLDEPAVADRADAANAPSTAGDAAGVIPNQLTSLDGGPGASSRQVGPKEPTSNVTSTIAPIAPALDAKPLPKSPALNVPGAGASSASPSNATTAPATSADGRKYRTNLD